MKRNIFIIIMMLASVLSANAQVGERRNDFSIGATGGYLLNTVDFQPKIKQSMKGGAMFGFATRFICEKYFKTIAGVQVEVNYAYTGWKELFNEGNENYVLGYQRDLHFIQVPLLMQLGWGREVKGFKFLFMAGPQLGFYLGGSDKKYGDWSQYSFNQYQTFIHEKDLENKFEYGIAAGMGCEFSSKIGHFILEGRYYYGLGDMYDSSKRGTIGRSANQTIYAKLTYLFDVVKTKNCDRK